MLLCHWLLLCCTQSTQKLVLKSLTELSLVLCCLEDRESLCDAGGSEGGVFVVIALTCSCDGTLSVSGLRMRPGCQPTRRVHAHVHKHAHTFCYLYNNTPLLAADPVLWNIFFFKTTEWQTSHPFRGVPTMKEPPAIRRRLCWYLSRCTSLAWGLSLTMGVKMSGKPKRIYLTHLCKEPKLWHLLLLLCHNNTFHMYIGSFLCLGK